MTMQGGFDASISGNGRIGVELALSFNSSSASTPIGPKGLSLGEAHKASWKDVCSAIGELDSSEDW